MSEVKEGLTEKEAAEHNAIAWLSLTNRELIERSASLDLPGDLHPEVGTIGGQLATMEQLTQARRNADAVAREHAGDAFVDEWIKQNREYENVYFTA